MDITLNSLQYIVEVAQTKSISKAAKHFYMSQPHLSNTIRSVEARLGTPLFLRTTNGMELTESGERFVQEARQILKQVHRLEQTIQVPPSEHININISLTHSYQVLRTITDVINENSEKLHFEMSIRETGPFQVIEDVRSGVAQLGILHFYDTQEKYFFHCFEAYNLSFDSHYKRPFLLAMSTDNPLARVPQINSDMCANQIIVLYGDYESPIAPYRFNGCADYISKKHIYVYTRAAAMDILSRCPNTYTLITGLHPAILSQYNLVLRKCADLEIFNIGCCIYPQNTVLNPVLRQIKKKILNIDWTERVVD